MSDRSVDEETPLLITQEASLDNAAAVTETAACDTRIVFPEGAQLYLALLFPYISILLNSLDFTITTTLAPNIALEFSSLSLISWLGTAYVVAAAAIQPLTGKLTDYYGRIPGLLLAFAVAIAGNIMCGLASSAFMIVFGRVLAGLGGGALGSITTIIISDLVPLRKRMIWHSIGTGIWASGVGIGAVVGGALNEWFGWRWAFLALTPLSTLIAISAWLTLRNSLSESSNLVPSTTRRLDVAGAAALTFATVALVLGLNLMQEGSVSWISLIALIISPFFFAIFIFIEFRVASDPIIPVQLLANRSVAAAMLSAFFVCACIMTMLYYVPLIIRLRGYSSLEVGRQLLGEPLGAAIGGLVLGMVMRAMGTYIVVKPISYLILLAGLLIFVKSDLNTSPAMTVLTHATMGAGFSGALLVALTGVLANTDRSVQASITGMLYAFRQVGHSTGLAASGVLFRWEVARRLSRHSWERTGPADEPHRDILEICSHDNWRGGERPWQCFAYGDAVHYVFVFALGLGLAGAFFGQMIESKPLDRKEEKQDTSA